MTPHPSSSELVSALADGHISGDEIGLAWQALERSDDALACWDQYHLIGDVLRSSGRELLDTANAAGADSFVTRLNLKLQAEGLRGVLPEANVRLSDVTNSENAPPSPDLTQLTTEQRPAANDDLFRWKLFAGVATMSAVAAIAWSSMASSGVSTELAQLAKAEDASKVLVASPQGLIVRDARLNELLAAHKQLGSTSALQAPSGFLQSAAYETTAVGGR
jgi:sigma-E factor negative regulatory protein RseA